MMNDEEAETDTGGETSDTLFVQPERSVLSRTRSVSSRRSKLRNYRIRYTLVQPEQVTKGGLASQESQDAMSVGVRSVRSLRSVRSSRSGKSIETDKSGGIPTLSRSKGSSRSRSRGNSRSRPASSSRSFGSQEDEGDYSRQLIGNRRQANHRTERVDDFFGGTYA